MPTLNHNQVNTSVIGMFSAMLSAIFATIVTTAVETNGLVKQAFSVLSYTMSAAEHITQAVDKRSEIYGKGMVSNGALAERETELKYKLRLAALEAQEVSVVIKAQTVKSKPAKSASKANGTAKPRKAKAQVAAPISAA